MDSHFYHGQLTFSRTKGLAETVIKKTEGNYFKFDLSHDTVAGLFILESTIVVLLIAQVPALQT